MSDRARAEDDDTPFDLEHEPLDRPTMTGIDWGGDGSNLDRPVRAHVLAALRPNSGPYPPPVDALRQIGDARKTDVAVRRAALGLSQEHLPDLLRMARDRTLYTANSDTDEIWAPLHAFYTLSDLDVAAIIPELIPLFDLDDDWFSEALPELLGRVGAPALEPIRAYLADRTRWAYGHSSACEGVEKIAKQHPELREQVVAILSDVLRDAEHYHEVAVTNAMNSLVELSAVEALPLIRRAFELGQIDEMVRGSWGDVLNDLGVEPEDDDPLLAESLQRFEERQDRLFPREQRERLQGAFARLEERAQQRPPAEATPSAPPPALRDLPKAAQAKARKQKNKRKIESASRKANRRKRK